MKQSERSSQGMYTIAITALFLASFFLLVVLGAKSYRNTVSEQSENMHTRALSAYLAAVVRANDAAHAVHVETGENGPVLVVADGSGNALRIYCREGRLLEDYAAEDAPLYPEDAQTIAETEVFTVEVLSDQLLSVTTDAGRVLLHLRSEGGVTP